MRVLVACEFSGVVRDALVRLGHDAISCDLLPSESPGPHYQGDVRELLYSRQFDMMIAHPPCTYLCRAGARWWKDRQVEQQEAIAFVKELWEAPIPRIAIENPVGILSTTWRKADQYIHPWMFGCGETKKTGLWLKNLPPLMATVISTGRHPRIHRMPDNAQRSMNRSRTYAGIAEAMAQQWGGLLSNEAA